MSLLDQEDEPDIVNVLSFYRDHGLTDAQAMQVLLHLLFTRTYAIATDAREAATELGYDIPYVLPGDGKTH